jgi:DNA-binding response OmpR family regulator
MIEQRNTDLIVSDVMMPNMSGIELCNILKSQPATSHIPVVLLTALNAEGSIIKGLNTGADDYITKPFSARILLARCRNILTMRRQLQQKYLMSAEPDVDMLTENNIDNDILQRAIQIIESNISAPAFDIIDFAQELGLSRTSLFNKIKSLTGMTPNNFMIDIKLKHAASSLTKKTNENVSNIAYSCGFNTLSHFNKLFKKTYGVTPSEYRNNKK